MAHHQHSVLTLKRKKAALAPLLRPYLKQDYLDGHCISEGLNFSRILPCPKTISGPARKKWYEENWGSRPFVLDGRFAGNEYFFSSINFIPFPIYQSLSTLIGERFSVEVHSVDDDVVGRWEFRADGMMRTMFYAEGYFGPAEDPSVFGRLPKLLRSDLRMTSGECTDSTGNKFEYAD